MSQSQGLARYSHPPPYCAHLVGSSNSGHLLHVGVAQLPVPAIPPREQGAISRQGHGVHAASGS